MKTFEGVGGIAPSFLTSAVDGGEWSASLPARFYRRELPPPPGNNCVGDWVSPRVSLDAMEKRKISSACRESNPDPPARSPSLYRLSCPKKYIDKTGIVACQ
jgi:hypothetical protein